MKSKIFSHTLVIFISLGGALFCARLLYLDIYVNKSTIDGLVEAGVVKEKFETVKRKFSDNMLWDVIDSKEKLYWNDSIQTAEKSQAVIQLLDGNEIRLGATSLVVLEKDNDKIALNLKSGQLVLDSKKSAADIKVNGVNIKNSEGNTLSLKVDEKKGQLTAIQTAADGTGKKIIINKDGSSEVKELPAVLTSPQAMFRKYSDQEQEIFSFTWVSKQTKNTFELSLDNEFKNIIVSKQTNLNKLTYKLRPGTYYWRVSSHNGLTSEVRSVDVIKMANPQLIGPTINEKITYRTDLPAIEFSWQPIERTSHYVFEASKDESFTQVLFKEETSKNVIKTSKLVDGPVFWRVSSVYGDSRKPSSVSKIEIKKLKEPQVPQILGPDSNFEVTYDYFSKNEGIQFNWDFQDDTEYRLVLNDKDNFDKPLVSADIKEKNYILKQSLSQGTYYWTLAYKNLDGNWVYKNSRKLKIGNLTPPLEAPVFEMEEVQ